ncbi:uncharacterized protein LOC135281905 isoform X2 [Passer domesticus]|uniref:uncharacterized protein LOC135281905 isoform X2 n=1 Tax=Passer domesticus TaxID=48849 RepID=UPI0030FEA8CF
MAAAAAALLSGQRSPVLSGVGAPSGQDFTLQQPQAKVSVAVGETLTLNCITSGIAEPGPVKWLKGWGTGNKTVYDQSDEDPSSRVMRAVNGSDTDFTIHISNFQPEDAGTYYCVKFVKGNSGEDKVFKSGSGTEVSVHEAALVPGMVAAAAVLCFLLLLGLFVALCMYRRKRQGGVGSPCPARTVAMGSFSSVPLRCCAGTPGTPRCTVLLVLSAFHGNVMVGSTQYQGARAAPHCVSEPSPVKSWMQRAPTCPARAARRRTTSTTPTCSRCRRPRSAAGARAQPPPSMPASGSLPSDARHGCLHSQAVSGWQKGRFCRAQQRRSGAVCVVRPDLSSARCGHRVCTSGELSQDLEALSTTGSDHEAKHLCLVQAVLC